MKKREEKLNKQYVTSQYHEEEGGKTKRTICHIIIMSHHSTMNEREEKLKGQYSTTHRRSPGVINGGRDHHGLPRGRWRRYKAGVRRYTHHQSPCNGLSNHSGARHYRGTNGSPRGTGAHLGVGHMGAEDWHGSHMGPLWHDGHPLRRLYRKDGCTAVPPCTLRRWRLGCCRCFLCFPFLGRSIVHHPARHKQTFTSPPSHSVDKLAGALNNAFRNLNII